MEGGSGDDGETPPAEAFKNVPLRARSNSGDSRSGGSGAARTPAPTRGEDGPPAVAPSAGREEEHPDDAKNGGALGGLIPEEDARNGGDDWLLTMNGGDGWLFPEEDLEDAENGGDGWLFPEKDLEDAENGGSGPFRMEYQEDAKNGGGCWMFGMKEPEDANNRGGGAPPAPSRTDEASASSGRERPADWDEKAWIRKGKMAGAPGPGGGGKLMGDAIRSHGGAAVPRRPSKSKKRKDPPFWYGFGSDGQSTSTSTAGSNTDYSFGKIGVVSTGLRAALAGAAPRRIYGRLLSRCDRCTNQARLLISFKSWPAEHGEHPLYAFLTAAEKAEVAGKELAVTSYDRRGQAFDLKLKYLECNRSFRVISKWSDFLRENGLAIDKGQAAPMDVMLDLWMFRPPTGEVRMVVLHYREGDAAHADAAFEEVGRRTRARRQGADDAAEEPPPEPDEGGAGGNGNDDAAAMEDVAGDAGDKGQDDAGVNGDAAPSDQPDGGAPTEAAADADGTTKTEEKETGGAPMAAESSSEAGGVASKAGAPGEADGTKTEEKEASAPTRVTAAQSSSSGKLEAAPPSTADAGVPGKATKQGLQALLQRSGLNWYDLLGAFALVLISQGL